MAQPMLRDQFESLTSLGVALGSIWYDQLSSVNEPGSDLFQFFNRLTTSEASETSQGIGGFNDVPVYTGTLEYKALELLYPKTYTPLEFADAMSVERKLVDDENYGVMNQRARLFGLSYDRTRYKDAAALFNNGFSTTYTRSGYTISIAGGDSKALMATDHPRSPATSTTQSNAGTSALTYDNLITTDQAMRGFVDSKGNPLNVMPDTLLVPAALAQTARRIVGSPGNPDNANNEANVNNGYRVVVSNYLTDANNWFLIDSRLANLYLKWYDRVMPEFTPDPTSDYTLYYRYRGYMRYTMGFDHWAWIYGHAVA